MVSGHLPSTPQSSVTVVQVKSAEQQLIESSISEGTAQELNVTAWTLVHRFGKSTTIHGVNRLLEESASRFERFVWLFTVTLAFIGSIYVSLALSKRFNDARFQTVIDDAQLPVNRIPFPVITICNLNRLNWKRIEEAKRRFLPNERSAEKLKLFERIVATYDDIRFAEFDRFSVLSNEPVEQLNHVNFSLVVELMTWRCEEMLTNCRWLNRPMNCCEIFSRRLTKSGPCLAFNTLESEEGRRKQRLDRMWPWHAGANGPRTALNVKVLINPDKHLPNRTNSKGLSVMVTEPNVWHWDPVLVPADTLSMIAIRPLMYFYAENTRSVSSDQRECVFVNERASSDFRTLHGFPYMQENCESECHQEYLMRYCNCTVDLMFPPAQYPSCKIKDMLCLAKFNAYLTHTHQPGEERYVRNFHEGMVCKCFRNCYSLNYEEDVYSAILPADIRGNVSFVDLDVHYHDDKVVAYRTRLVFGWLDLIVAFGGTASLFLGCSVISAMELVYFAIIDFPKFLVYEFKKRLQLRKRTKLDKMRRLKCTSRNSTVVQSEKSFYRGITAKSTKEQDNMEGWNHLTLAGVHSKIQVCNTEK